MSKFKLHRGQWVVVCDGTKALVLENVGDEMFPNLRTKEVYQQEAPPTREQGTDAPGRAFSSVGEGRSSVGQTDWHSQGERRFLEKLAARLDAAVQAGEVKSLIIAAPPRALGALRQVYSQGLRGALAAEIDKDLVKMPVHEIEKHLAA
ncbi:MAG TPA: host attachment protein [Xanthobacteraceae bacterium]|nr:host attachment protein [Xanthobacteraceae bacterium]